MRRRATPPTSTSIATRRALGRRRRHALGRRNQHPGKPVRRSSPQLFPPAVDLPRTNRGTPGDRVHHGPRRQILRDDCQLLILRPASPTFRTRDNLNSRHRTVSCTGANTVPTQPDQLRDGKMALGGRLPGIGPPLVVLEEQRRRTPLSGRALATPAGGVRHQIGMGEMKSELVADFIPESPADFPRNMHSERSVLSPASRTYRGMHQPRGLPISGR
jgi:hypothetical protein